MPDEVVTKTPAEAQQIVASRFSALFGLHLNDWGRGLLIAILTTPLTIIYESVTATPMQLVFDWKTILGGALAGGIGYVIKNLGTGAGGKLLTNK
jgi:hypothetical protein